MANDEDGPINDLDLDLDSWDPEDTFWAEKPDLKRVDLGPKKKSIPHQKPTAEASNRKPNQWEYQLEEGVKISSKGPSDLKAEEERPAPIEMLARELEGMILAQEQAHEDGDLVAEPAEYIDGESEGGEEDEKSFQDSMVVLEKILVLRKCQAVRAGRPVQETELMALACESLLHLPLNVMNHLDYIAEFVARVIDMEVSD
jgi:hypothetical protein